MATVAQAIAIGQPSDGVEGCCGGDAGIEVAAIEGSTSA
jgi:hypothetical protein